MTRNWITLVLVLGAASNVLADGPTFTAIDYPGSAGTQPFGINSRGDIVGFYTGADKATHGFLLSGSQYSTIDFPGALNTWVYGTNPAGDIVGQYTLADKIDHSYLLRGGQFTTIDYPGAISTDMSAINPRGDIVGFYVGADNFTHGYLLSVGQYTTFDFPGTTSTIPSGINPQGDITGSYSSSGHAFLMSDGDFTSWDFPGATFTNTTGLNARGDIVGRYVAAGLSHGYLLSGGHFTTIDFPGAVFSGATGINQRGDIIGRYRNADGVFHGFLLTGFQRPCMGTTTAPEIAMTTNGPAVTHSSDFSLVTASKPAAAGEVLSIFAKGLGPTRPSVAGGQAFPSSPLASVDSLVEVRVNGRSTVVFGAVGLPGSVDGYQVNFRVPADAAKGLAAVQLSAGSVASPPVSVLIQ